MSKKKSNSVLGYVPQSNLHGKILEIVNNRINPQKYQLLYQKGSCRSCVEPSGKEQRKKTTGMKEENKNEKKIKEKVKNNNQSLAESKVYEVQRPSLGFSQTKKLIKIKGRKLELSTKNIQIHIDSEKLKEEDDNISREQSKQNILIVQLKRELAQKQQKIQILESQLQLNKDEIKQLNKDIQGIRQLARNKAYSDNHLNNNDVYSEISMDPPPSLKDVIMTDLNFTQNNQKISFLTSIEHIYQSSCDYEHLIRIICTQAKQLERQKISIDLIKNSSINRRV